MNDLCKKCNNLPCKNRPERRIRNLPSCQEDEKQKKDREDEVD